MPASRSIDIDESLWPVVIIRYKGTTTAWQFAEMLAARSRYLDRHERHVILQDLSQSSSMSSGELRRMQVEWLKKEEARLSQWVVGAAYVTDSAPLRLLLSIIQHLRPLPMPHVIVPRMSEAIAWITTRMRQSGLETRTHPLLERFGLNDGRCVG
jgi:hypothetical protein